MIRVITLRTSSEKRFEFWKKQCEKAKVDAKIVIRKKFIFGKDCYQIKFEVNENTLNPALLTLLIPNEDIEFIYEE